MRAADSTGSCSQSRRDLSHPARTVRQMFTAIRALTPEMVCDLYTGRPKVGE